MVVTLKNKKIELSVNSFGAEMNSLKDAVTGKDYLWTGNPDVWKFHAPVLFPHKAGSLPQKRGDPRG